MPVELLIPLQLALKNFVSAKSVSYVSCFFFLLCLLYCGDLHVNGCGRCRWRRTIYLEGAHDHIILEHKGDGNKDKV